MCAFARPVRFFYQAFPRFSPQVHNKPMNPQARECDDGRVGERLRKGFPSKRGPKEFLEGLQLWEWMGMVVETQDWGCQRRWSPSDIGD